MRRSRSASVERPNKALDRLDARLFGSVAPEEARWFVDGNRGNRGFGSGGSHGYRIFSGFFPRSSDDAAAEWTCWPESTELPGDGQGRPKQMRQTLGRNASALVGNHTDR